MLTILFSQNYALIYFFYSKQFQVFKIAQFDFKVTLYYSLRAESIQ